MEGGSNKGVIAEGLKARKEGRDDDVKAGKTQRGREREGGRNGKAA